MEIVNAVLFPMGAGLPVELAHQVFAIQIAAFVAHAITSVGQFIRRTVPTVKFGPVWQILTVVYTGGVSRPVRKGFVRMPTVVVIARTNVP